MKAQYEEYLSYLGELSDLLEKMTETVKTKGAAARTGDLVEVDKCMKQEQVYSMTLRSMDQKRDKLLKAMGLSGVSISGLADHYPQELRLKASQAVELAQRRYQVYVSASDSARTTMECALKDIERMFPSGTKPASDTPEPPPRMKTDFRA